MSLTLVEQFEKAGIRMTPQRASIMETIISSNDHPDAEQIFLRAKSRDNSTSIATTYRTLNVLEEAGLIQKLNMQDGKVRYEADRSAHNHLVDQESGKIHEFRDIRLEKILKKIADEMGYDVVTFKVEVTGKKQADVECGCIHVRVY